MIISRHVYLTGVSSEILSERVIHHCVVNGRISKYFLYILKCFTNICYLNGIM